MMPKQNEDLYIYLFIDGSSDIIFLWFFLNLSHSVCQFT